jgi:hypothetical protein
LLVLYRNYMLGILMVEDGFIDLRYVLLIRVIVKCILDKHKVYIIIVQLNNI